MTSSSNCFFLVSLVVSLLFFLGSTLTMASTKDIDSICNLVKNKTFCEQTLKAYPPAASATNIAKLVKATLDLGMNEAKKRAGFVAGLEKEPSFKKYFKMCNESYTSIVQNFRGARLEIEENLSEFASYDLFRCTDYTNTVKDTIGKNTDKTSKIKNADSIPVHTRRHTGGCAIKIPKDNGSQADSPYFSSDELSFAKGRDYDPDKYRSDMKKFQKKLNEERKGVVRELRIDSYFIHERC
ncbi:hypothetical protein Bca101_027335 [Brassica carinata]